uniref:Uncharacterized protein n=2 Tax=viral metagenome TaxID=1070528 RepID=A0A6M3K9C8_9ZZZZ
MNDDKLLPTGGGGYAVCSCGYTPADPFYQRPDAPTLWCSLPPDHEGHHHAEVAPGLSFEWGDGYGGLRYIPVPTGSERETVDQRMRDLHDRLRAAGSVSDAKIVEDAAWTIATLETDVAWAASKRAALAASPPEASEEPSDDPIDNPPPRIYLLAEPDRWGEWALGPYRRCDAEYRYVGRAGARPVPPVEPLPLPPPFDLAPQWVPPVEPEGVEKDDEGRPYQCGAFVSDDSRWECRLESDHGGDHEWRLHDTEGVEPEPVAESAQNSKEREKSVKRLRSLAEAVRGAAKWLPAVPVSAEIVAGAGIMGMANWLERVADMLVVAPDTKEPSVTDERWDQMKARHNREACAWQRRHGITTREQQRTWQETGRLPTGEIDD